MLQLQDAVGHTIQVFVGQLPNPLLLPNGEQVCGAQVGDKVGADEQWAIVDQPEDDDDGA